MLQHMQAAGGGQTLIPRASGEDQGDCRELFLRFEVENGDTVHGILVVLHGTDIHSD